MVLRVVVENTLYLPHMAEVHVGIPIISDPSSRERSSLSDEINKYKDVISKALEVGFSAPGSRAKTTIFKGEIVSIEPKFTAGAGFAELIIRGYDKSHRMHATTRTRTFLNQKDSDIASQIASEYSLSTDIQATSTVHDHIFQSALTDMEFLQDRAKRIGYEFFINDEKLYFRPASQNDGTTELIFGVNLIEFDVRVNGVNQVPKVVVKGWDVNNKSAIQGESSSSQTHPKIGLGKSGIDIAKKFGAESKMQVRQNVFDQSEANQVAKGILDDLNSGFIEATGVTFGNPDLTAGKIIKVSEVNPVFDGEYKLTTVRHDYNAGHFQTYFSVEGHKPRNLVQMLDTGQSQATTFPGVVSAIVTDIDDPQAMNRVKVKYPWMDDNSQSWWARVVILGGGAERGLFVMPEVEDEVLIAFEQGDFNKPYVIGGLFNGSDKPPESQSSAIVGGQVKKRVFQSRTGHRLDLTDSEGGDNFIELADGSGNYLVKLDVENQVLTIYSNGDIELTSQKNITLSAAQAVNIEAGSTGKFEAQQSIDIKSMQIKVEGDTMLTLKAVQVELNGSAMAVIKGGIVKIN